MYVTVSSFFESFYQSKISIGKIVFFNMILNIEHDMI